MASHIKKLLKQLPFYGKTISELSELPFFEKP